MPSKHIDKELWKKIQEKHIEVVTETKMSLNDTDILKTVLKRGLEVVKNEDFLKYTTSKI
ncbi:hypothetical protein Q7269_07200 [Glaesserella parasuis]|nr:hypothetical protein [Glaesserella parasuis]MDP0313728.1 hypothetical protein [Glaesserella parasuis]